MGAPYYFGTFFVNFVPTGFSIPKTGNMRPIKAHVGLLFLLLTAPLATAQDIQWMSWEEAVNRSQSDRDPKKLFVDVYTDWCGWCKKMDKDTFQNPEVAKYMQANFYMVKLDGEGKEPI